MTREFMDHQLGRMVVLRGMPGDSEAYWMIFHGYSGEPFEEGVNLSIKTRTFFPTPAELRMDYAQANPQAVYQSPRTDAPLIGGEPRTIKCEQGEVTVKVYRDWKYYCEVCSDSGRRSHWCGSTVPPHPWIPKTRCMRTAEHGDHEWVEACACTAGSRFEAQLAKPEAGKQR